MDKQILKAPGGPPSDVERIKEESNFLRGTLAESMVEPLSAGINEDDNRLMKFHGSYQQDNRDKRTSGKGKFYQFMMRTRQPAGLVSNQLYLVMDTLADKVRPLAKLPAPASYGRSMLAAVQSSQLSHPKG